MTWKDPGNVAEYVGRVDRRWRDFALLVGQAPSAG